MNSGLKRSGLIMFWDQLATLGVWGIIIEVVLIIFFKIIEVSIGCKINSSRDTVSLRTLPFLNLALGFLYRSEDP